MPEHEKFEQVGRLVEEVSRLKEEVHHVGEKLMRTFLAYQAMTQGQNPGYWRAENGEPIISRQPNRSGVPPQVDLGALLNQHELVEVLEKKQKLTAELNQATQRLRDLAPHLL